MEAEPLIFKKNDMLDMITYPLQGGCIKDDYAGRGILLNRINTSVFKKGKI